MLGERVVTVRGVADSGDITVLVQLNSLALGGTQINAVDFARTLRSHGFRSVLRGPRDTIPHRGPTIFDVAADSGVELEAYEPALGVLRGGAAEMSRRADALGAQLVHVYGEDGDARSAFWGPCYRGRRPLVQTIYEMQVSPQTYRHTSLIVGTGYLAEELRDRPGPTTLVSPPVDLNSDRPDSDLGWAFRREHGLEASRLLLVIVSRLDRAMKAFPVEIAVRAVARLNDLGADLVVVGTGSEEEYLRACATETNLQLGRDAVKFLGAMADPRPAYAAADLVLGMGSSAARALAFGRPLIVQGEYGTAEVFEPEHAADIFRRSFWSDIASEEPVPALERAVRAVAEAPAASRMLSKFGREFAVAQFGLDAMAARISTVYRDRLSAQHLGRSWTADLVHELPELRRSLSRRLERLVSWSGPAP